METHPNGRHDDSSINYTCAYNFARRQRTLLTIIRWRILFDPGAVQWLHGTELNSMAYAIAWILFGMGALHIVFGLFRFKEPLKAALSAGFFGKFQAYEPRRTAFWFMVAGPLLMLSGHLAIRAVAAGDIEVLKIIGLYLFFMSVIGVAAIPKSPILGSLILSVFLLAAGFGFIE
jgi:Family of unknown function (DUF6463)